MTEKTIHHSGALVYSRIGSVPSAGESVSLAVQKCLFIYLFVCWHQYLCFFVLEKKCWTYLFLLFLADVCWFYYCERNKSISECVPSWTNLSVDGLFSSSSLCTRLSISVPVCFLLVCSLLLMKCFCIEEETTVKDASNKWLFWFWCPSISFNRNVLSKGFNYFWIQISFVLIMLRGHSLSLCSSVKPPHTKK